MSKTSSSLFILLRLVFIGVCLYAAHQLLSDVQPRDIWDYVLSLPAWKLGTALLCVACSYAALVFYDVLGCRYAQANVPFLSIAATAALANAISNAVGFALLSGGAVRLRCYKALGVSGQAVVKISLFCTATFLLGLTLAASLGLIFDTRLFVDWLGIGEAETRWIGACLLLICLALPSFVHKRRLVQWGEGKIALPSSSIVWAQYAVGLVDILATGAVAYLLLPADHAFGFLAFISLFSAALWLGLISHVPGGLGVFEAVMLGGLGNQMPTGSLLGALLLYRVLYYVLPFVVASAVVVMVEGKAVVRHVADNVSLPARVIMWMTKTFLPTLLAVLVAFSGVVLLISGTTPAADGRIEWLVHYFPMGLIEGSHLMGSVVGFAMLFVAHGIYNRYDSAYPTALLLLASGLFFSLTKGFDYEEAAFMAVIFCLVALSRRAFYRPSKISMMELSLGWWLFIAVTLAIIVWLLFFAYKQVDYDEYLWWKITLGLEGDASRSLRSTLVVVAVAFAVGVHQFFRPSRPLAPPPSAEEMEIVRRLARQASTTNAFLALTGDKHFLFSPHHDAFIMFGQTHRSLIAMGDPIGNPTSFPALIWRLRELADRHQRRLAFYQVGTKHLTHYIDSGMQFARLGEEARLDLKDFTLEGGRYKQIRQNLTRGEHQNLTFEIVPMEGVAQIEPALHAISDQWLTEKKTREKTFSLGAYRASYIEQFPVAVVRYQGRIVAFANVWALDEKQELSVDLMRHAVDAPQGTMDFLFGSMLVWGKEQGYAYFNLGMAPMVGFLSHRLAPLWTRWGAFIYTHGESFYNFKGLYSFKNKYHPVWRPRYLAFAGGSVLSLLLEVAILIAGGIKGLFRK
ncbi:MAG: bifunctional lysylphosphatidylglycerol flippase/synthetase MprF [Bdellovibrionales bacterium]|jgi:phosphatidylglycerol lysyltransferase